MKLNKLLLLLVIFLTACLTCPINPIAVHSAMADTATENGAPEETEDGEEADDGEGPSMSNPVQAEKAESIAAALATKSDKDITDAQSEVEKAETALTEVKESGDETAITEAKEALAEAQEGLDAALAGAGGVSVDEITAMRMSRMGREEICHQAGINSSVLGRGHGKHEKTKEMKEATERNQKRAVQKHAKIGETTMIVKDQKDSSSSAIDDKDKDKEDKDKEDKDKDKD